MPRKLLSVSEISAELLRDRRTVSDALRHVKPDGELRGRPAYFVLTAFSALYGAEPAGARERRSLAEAQLAEMRLARQRRELFSGEAIASLLSRDFGVIRERLLSIPPNASAMVPADVRELVYNVVRAEVIAALEELSSPAELLDEAAA